MSNNEGVDLVAVVDAVASGRVHWRKHVLQRMIERNVSRADGVKC